eukprot:2704695-Pyramimonas_sp.AAC.1
MEQTDAPDDLCSCPKARVKKKTTTRIKITRNSRSRPDAFWQRKVPDRAEIKMASGNKIEY